MARRDNAFLLVAAGLGFLAWQLLKPKATNVAANAASGGGVTGSPHQVTGAPAEAAPGIPFNYAAWPGWGI